MAKPTTTGPNPNKLPLDRLPIARLANVLPPDNPLIAALDPPPSAPVDLDGAAGASVPENLAIGSAVGITAFAIDPQGDEVRYSFGADGSGAPILLSDGFAIDPVTGVVTLAAPLDYESRADYALPVIATDSGGRTSMTVFTVTVTNVAPSAPVDANPAPNRLAETAAIGSDSGIQASAIDPNGGSVHYFFRDAGGNPVQTLGKFTIAADTGVVTLAGALDYETAASHSLTIYASDSSGAVSSSQHVVAVTDVFIPVALQVVAGDATLFGQPTDNFFPAISGDGTKVAFQSLATNLVSGDTNNFEDIYVRNLLTGAIERATTSSSGVQANNRSYHQKISYDGSKVFFTSDASNLVAGDTNARADVFIKDLATGAVTRLSTTAAGLQGNGLTFLNAISADAKFAILQSLSTNWLTTDVNGTGADLWIKNVATGELKLVSANAAGEQGNGFAGIGAVSADGRYVTFGSSSTNLVPGDTNGASDAFIKDMQTGAITRITNGGVELDGLAAPLAISGDGQKVAFVSRAASLGNTDLKSDLFIFDVASGTITPVRTAAGDEQNGQIDNTPFFTADGSHLFFQSSASNWVAGDTNGATDIFMLDVASGVVSLLSRTLDGTQGNADSYGVSVSADGSRIAFGSQATNLVAGDSDPQSDVFVLTFDHYAASPSYWVI
ncbi:cadherin domain-containing protein [Sphingomonas humi]|uniref:Cadherin domain-containing protein n=1 Tax=Sphingomonas humi TaxID=335630 RepID=A0ABP7S030_9SPHN